MANQRMAAMFSNDVEYHWNNDTTTITAGLAVVFDVANITDRPYPSPNPEGVIKKPVLGVKVADAIEENFLGVAAETIAPGDVGPIVTGGRFEEAAIAASVDIAVGDGLVPTASGEFTEIGATTVVQVCAIALEAYGSGATSVAGHAAVFIRRGDGIGIGHAD